MDSDVQSSQVSKVDRVIQAIRGTTVMLDSSTGGVPLEMAWGNISVEYSTFSFDSLSREEFERLKGAIQTSLTPKGGDRKAKHFIRNLFMENGPGQYKNAGDVPRGKSLLDWYLDMANAATVIQQNVLAIRRMEGELDYE